MAAAAFVASHRQALGQGLFNLTGQQKVEALTTLLQELTTPAQRAKVCTGVVRSMNPDEQKVLAVAAAAASGDAPAVVGALADELQRRSRDDAGRAIEDMTVAAARKCMRNKASTDTASRRNDSAIHRRSTTLMRVAMALAHEDQAQGSRELAVSEFSGSGGVPATAAVALNKRSHEDGGADDGACPGRPCRHLPLRREANPSCRCSRLAALAPPGYHGRPLARPAPCRSPHSSL